MCSVWDTCTCFLIGYFIYTGWNFKTSFTPAKASSSFHLLSKASWMGDLRSEIGRLPFCSVVSVWCWHDFFSFFLYVMQVLTSSGITVLTRLKCECQVFFCFKLQIHKFPFLWKTALTLFVVVKPFCFVLFMGFFFPLEICFFWFPIIPGLCVSWPLVTVVLCNRMFRSFMMEMKWLWHKFPLCVMTCCY